MALILSKIMTMVGNLVVFSFIPFLWWFFRHRKKVGFFKWLGFIKPKLESKWWVLVIFAILYIFFYKFDYSIFLSEETLNTIQSNDSVAANVYTGLGFAAIIPAFIENVIANGVAEELFFRGFLCKRFCSKFGTVGGIIIQGALFGFMHNALYLIAGIPIDMTYHLLIFLFSGMAALLLGYLNEKIYNGSIIPSIIVHGTGNFIGSLLKAF